MSNEDYLRSLERQIDARKQQRELEAARELALDRSMIRRNQEEPFSRFDRGGGGAPLRSANGSVIVGVRGLFDREMRGEGVATPVKHGVPTGPVCRDTKRQDAARPKHTDGISPLGIKRVDPNRGHDIFGGISGEERPDYCARRSGNQDDSNSSVPADSAVPAAAVSQKVAEVDALPPIVRVYSRGASQQQIDQQRQHQQAQQEAQQGHHHEAPRAPG